jgi:hypothetical protein
MNEANLSHLGRSWKFVVAMSSKSCLSRVSFARLLSHNTISRERPRPRLEGRKITPGESSLGFKIPTWGCSLRGVDVITSPFFFVVCDAFCVVSRKLKT